MIEDDRIIRHDRILRDAHDNAYREGFEAGAKAMQARCIATCGALGISDPQIAQRFYDSPVFLGATNAEAVAFTHADNIAAAIQRLPLPTPTTKG